MYRNLFSRLAQEEEVHGGPLAEEVPSFGLSTWPWSAPAHQDPPADMARAFYNYWGSFVTAKDFAWADKWNMADAPDRRVRRLMERDNKKARDDGRREYNDAIRSLVLYIRKRDPRYKAHLAHQQYQQQQLQSTPSTAARPRPSQPEPAEEFVEQDWQRVRPSRDDDDEWNEAEGGEEWECVACARAFRSEAAWESHERSKKHLKAVEQLRLEMLRENEELALDADPEDEADAEVAATPEVEAESETQEISDQNPGSNSKEAETRSEEEEEDDSLDRNAAAQRAAKQRKKARKKKVQAGAPVAGDSHVLETLPEVLSSASRGTPGKTLHGDPGAVAEVEREDGEEDSSRSTPAQVQLSKKEKRRAKEAAKKAKEAEEAARPQKQNHQCNVCHEQFDSRTLLFAHITRSGHAAAEPIPVPESGTTQQPKRKKK